MRFVEVSALPNGAHRNQAIMGEMETPEGWAVIPEEMDIPDSFPFVNISAVDGIVESMEAIEEVEY